MLSRLFARPKPGSDDLPPADSRIALGALLVRVALADRDYKQSEVAAIDRILAATFDLGPVEAAKLRATCTEKELWGSDPDEFVRVLRAEVPYDERRALARGMWQVALADGERDELEDLKLREIEAALGLTPEDSAAARDAALGGPV